MGTNWLTFIFVICLTSFYSLGQIEEQRKYKTNSIEQLFNFISSSQGTDSLRFHNHSDYNYFDLYLESTNNILVENGLSLRFRKREYDSITSPTYSFQLKSEMDSEHSFRLEVEESELYFYLLKDDTSWVSITSILDTIFHNLEYNSSFLTSNDYLSSLSLLNSWIKFKYNAPVEPFQEMRYLNLDITDLEGLRPILYGKTARSRSHIYLDNSCSTQEEFNKIDKGDLPVFFQKDSSYNWILESSFDRSCFRSIEEEDVECIYLTEFEVENKYYNSHVGTEYMNHLERFLEDNFNTEMILDSKYRQALNKMK